MRSVPYLHPFLSILCNILYHKLIYSKQIYPWVLWVRSLINPSRGLWKYWFRDRYTRRDKTILNSNLSEVEGSQYWTLPLRNLRFYPDRETVSELSWIRGQHAGIHCGSIACLLNGEHMASLGSGTCCETRVEKTEFDFSTRICYHLQRRINLDKHLNKWEITAGWGVGIRKGSRENGPGLCMWREQSMSNRASYMSQTQMPKYVCEATDTVG